MVAPIPVIVVGLVVFVLAVHHRLGKLRILRRGKLDSRNVLAIERTETVINDQRRYRVGVEGGTLYAYGGAVDLAEKHLADNKPVRVFVDPGNEQKLIGLDLLLIYEE